MTPSSPPRGVGVRRGEEGLVLLEVLVALVIFATVVLAWARATDSAIEAAARANQERTLRMLAARKLAEVRAKPADYEEGGEGGFEEEVDFGDENPYLDYRWTVESTTVVAAGYSEEPDTSFLFSVDEEAGAPEAKEGGKAPEAVLLLRLVITVSYVPVGDVEGEEFRVVTFLPAPEEEGEGGDGGGNR